MALRARLELGATGKLPRESRIRHRSEFARIHKLGFRAHTESFTIIAAASPEGSPARFGCAVSRKIGNAVVRNRVRRVLKEIFRRCASELPPIDLVFVAKPEAAAQAKRGLDVLAAELVPGIEKAIAGLERRKEQRHGR